MQPDTKKLIELCVTTGQHAWDVQTAAARLRLLAARRAPKGLTAAEVELLESLQHEANRCTNEFRKAERALLEASVLGYAENLGEVWRRIDPRIKATRSPPPPAARTAHR